MKRLEYLEAARKRNAKVELLARVLVWSIVLLALLVLHLA